MRNLLTSPALPALLAASAIWVCAGTTLFAQANDEKEATFYMGRIKYSSNDGNDCGTVELGKREGVTVEGVTPIGRSYDAIIETAGGRGVDLVILGSYGKTGLKKALMGSSTEKVIGHVGCAVLVMKGA